jgi:dipeptidyl aminopeptidase/acylaminoacyl peptidase
LRKAVSMPVRQASNRARGKFFDMQQVLRGLGRVSKFWAILLLLPATYSLAQAAIPLPLEDVLKVRVFGEKSPVVWAPDSKWVAYTVSDSQRAKNEAPETFVRTGVVSRSEGDVWISNISTGEARNLTGGRGSNWDPAWSPDGRYLAFLSDRAGKGQANLWLWDSTNGNLKIVSDLPVRAIFSAYGIVWTPDSQGILISTVPNHLSVDEYVAGVLAPKSRVAPSQGSVPDSTVQLYESQGNSSSANDIEADTFNLDEFFLHDLVLVKVVDGSCTTIARGRRIEKYALSPDGTYVAYAVPKRFLRPGVYRRVYDLVIVKLAAMKERVVAKDILLNDEYSWSPDSSRLAYAVYGTDGKQYELYVASVDRGEEPHQIGVLRHETFDGIWLSPLWDARGEYLLTLLDGLLWKASTSHPSSLESRQIPGRRIDFIVSQRDGELWTSGEDGSTLVVSHDEDGKQDGFYELNVVTGESRRLLEQGQCYTCRWPPTDRNTYLTVVSPNGQKVIYIAENGQHPPDLWVSERDFRTSQRLTHLNAQLEKYRMGVPRQVEWWSEEGVRLYGAVLLPPDYQQGRQYPLIMWVYPGSRLSNHLDHFGFGTNAGPFNMQLLATRGYVVLFPDAVEEVGERTRGLAESILPGVNKLIEMGIADPQRIGVMGHSQGGFAVLTLLVQTKRFKAAVAADGWGDSTAYYGSMRKDGSGHQYGQAERQLGGTPWDHPITYVGNSPMYHLDRVATPLLLVHGAEDDEIAASLSDEIFVGLRRLGKRVEYARYAGEPHVPMDWSYANQLDLGNRILGWFDRYLKGREGRISDGQSQPGKGGAPD